MVLAALKKLLGVQQKCLLAFFSHRLFWGVLNRDFQQIHQLKQEKSYFLVSHIFISYNMNKMWEIQVFIAKNVISSILIGGFVEKDRALLYMSRIGKKFARSDLRTKSVFDDPH